MDNVSRPRVQRSSLQVATVPAVPGELEVLVGYPRWVPTTASAVFLVAESDDGAYDVSDRMHVRKGVGWSGGDNNLGGALVLVCKAARRVTLHVIAEDRHGGPHRSLGSTRIPLPSAPMAKRWRLRLNGPLDMPVELVWHTTDGVWAVDDSSLAAHPHRPRHAYVPASMAPKAAQRPRTPDRAVRKASPLQRSHDDAYAHYEPYAHAWTAHAPVRPPVAQYAPRDPLWMDFQDDAYGAEWHDDVDDEPELDGWQGDGYGYEVLDRPLPEPEHPPGGPWRTYVATPQRRSAGKHVWHC